MKFTLENQIFPLPDPYFVGDDETVTGGAVKVLTYRIKEHRRKTGTVIKETVKYGLFHEVVFSIVVLVETPVVTDLDF